MEPIAFTRNVSSRGGSRASDIAKRNLAYNNRNIENQSNNRNKDNKVYKMTHDKYGNTIEGQIPFIFKDDDKLPLLYYKLRPEMPTRSVPMSEEEMSEDEKTSLRELPWDGGRRYRIKTRRNKRKGKHSTKKTTKKTKQTKNTTKNKQTSKNKQSKKTRRKY
jgi:hypothetical protein